MCGIAGILLAPQSDPRSLSAVRPMLKSLDHRGPDGEGVWIHRDAGVALGHRRLAIVDLSEAGLQPMHSASGRHVITFNGEIYNFRDLRGELESAGHRFRGASDTEVMLCAIEAWGLETALRRFEGMFAFALWDARDRMLHLARDRMGKKPLYVAATTGGLVFASELKAIRCYPEFTPELNRDAATVMLAKGWVPDDQCIWQDVFKLAPGSLLSITAQGFAAAGGAAWLSARAQRWWSVAAAARAGLQQPLEGDDDALTDELDKVLRLAVGERMVADVPLGAFLSGGVDSSAVAALMQAQSAKAVRTFTIAFDEGGFDEAPFAKQVAHHLGTDHTELHLSPVAARDVIPDLPQIWDEPFADESQIPTLLVARLARQHVTVALSGDGGDECFAGYGRHFLAGRLRRQQSLPLLMRRTAAAGLGLLSRAASSDLPGGAFLPASLRHTLRSDRLDRLAGLLSAVDENDLFRRLKGASGGGLGRVRPAASEEPPALDGLLSRLLLDDMTGYLPGDILVKLDRATMANSLEGRCPLLDRRVVEFAWRLPANAKVRDGKGKWILRNLLRRYLPDRLVDRPKQGFDVPIGAWLRGPLQTWAADLVADMRRDADGVIDGAKAAICWREHLQGHDRTRELWTALMFQAWRNETGRRPSPKPSGELYVAEA